MGYDLNKLFTNAGPFIFDSDNKLLDPFYSSVVSPTSEREKLLYKFSIQNLFQTKYRQVDSETFTKATILDWDIKMQYDALAESVNWSPITSSIKSQIPIVGSKLDIDLTHDIYKIDNNGVRTNQYYNQFYGVPIPGLTKLHIRTSFSLSGYRLLSFDNTKNMDLSVDDISPFYIDDKKLWAVNFALTYKKEKKIDNSTINNTINWLEQFQLGVNTTLNFSKKWKLSHRVSFDLVEQTMGWQTFAFTRNLHCWEFSFNWIPGRSYFLHIYVKKPELRDIKIESRSKNDRNNLF